MKGKTSLMSFESLKITEPILRALAKQGYTTPTPIQAAAIPPLLEGRDLLGCAQTGTGKTAAFSIPIIQNILREKSPGRARRKLRALILTPTRELAAQIDGCLSAYGANTGLKHLVIFGGVSQNPQVQSLKLGVDILVATPGRLLDLMGQNIVDLSDVGFFVLDEADRMLDMGFLRDVEKVISRLPEKRQTMLFSATMPSEIEKLAKGILRDPVTVTLSPDSPTVENIRQSVCFVNKANKTKLLLHLLKTGDIDSALVFTRTKRGANQLSEALRAAGESSTVMHANKSQSFRQQALEQFKSGKVRVLVATDIIGRGIDIAELSHVINYHIPEAPEDYVHRIGRTGRAGLSGTAISFCDGQERKSLANIEKLIGPIPEYTAHPFTFVASAEPVVQKTNAPSHARRTNDYPKAVNKARPYSKQRNRSR